MLKWLWRKFNKKNLERIEREKQAKILRLAQNCEDYANQALDLINEGDTNNAKIFYEYYKEEFIKFKKLKGEN